MHFLAGTLLLGLFVRAIAQFPPKPSGTTVVKSAIRPGVSISFKRTQICETTKGVNSYSGYVNLPANFLGVTYDVNTFFWYFEARENPSTAPLAIYLAGGPGQSSMIAATGQGGPCYINNDSNSTALNPWSWNNKVNVLYIDQPAQTGYSYDIFLNGTLDQLTGVYTPQVILSNHPLPPNPTLFYGTFPSQLTSKTANNSVQAAPALYQFMQTWINEFPKYKTSNRKISLWTNSWGGYFGPAILAYFDKQNKKIAGKTRGSTPDTILPLDTLGLLQGCVDLRLEAPYYPQIAFNNTYNFPVISQAVYQDTLKNAAMPNGCQDLIDQCRTLAIEQDPDFNGNINNINKLCEQALGVCFSTVIGPTWGNSNRSAFDLTNLLPDPYPYTYPQGFFNERWVQAALGVPVNFTAYSNAVYDGFVTGTGDAVRNDISNLNYLLQNGITVAMIYGDRDYRCNWLGAENISLSASFPGATKFRASGYANIVTNVSYVGGMVRQAGLLSFSRIFQAGHYPHASQPETVYRIFNRAVGNRDMATGLLPLSSSFLASVYQTLGPMSSFGVKNVLPPSPMHECSVWQISNTCSQAQVEALGDGSAVVRNYIVVKPTN